MNLARVHELLGTQRPEYQAYTGDEADDDARSAHIRQHDESVHEWDHAHRVGLSLGMITPEQADKVGYRFAENGERVVDPWGHGRTGWTRLPSPMWHTTTDLPGVMEHGLRSRYELGQSRGPGLGGGSEYSISMTDSPHVAQNILDSVKFMHSVLNEHAGHTYNDLVERAKRGEGGSKPFDEPFIKQVAGDSGVRSAEEMTTRQGAPEWNRETGEVTFTREPISHEDHMWRKYRMGQAFLWNRHFAGGPDNPHFVSTDIQALADKNPADFGVVQAEGVGHGHPMQSLGEWRTYHGNALGRLSPGQFGIQP